MLKIVVFDNGMGGELLADYLKKELPLVEVIRVIDWRHGKKLFKSRRAARRAAETALRPYINHVDLVIFASLLVSSTSLKYFRRTYPKQLFIGQTLVVPDPKNSRSILVLTTTDLLRAREFRAYLYRLRRPTTILRFDDWPRLIDDDEMTTDEVRHALRDFLPGTAEIPSEIILANSHFKILEPTLRSLYARKGIKIYDTFAECYREVCRTLHIRGALKKKKK